MAQFKTITAAKEAGLPGVEFIKTDKAITEVVIGGKLRIRKGESYAKSLEVLIEQPFEEAKRFRMTATIDGFDPKITYHDDRYSADSEARELEAKGAEAAVEEVTALVNDDGEVVGLASEVTAQPVAEMAF